MPKLKKRRKQADFRGKVEFSSLRGHLLSKTTIPYRCLACGASDSFPYDAVSSFERLCGDGSDEPPQFVCRGCGGVLYPEYYKSRCGAEYRIEDVRLPTEDRS